MAAMQPPVTFQLALPDDLETLLEAVRRYYEEDHIPFDTAPVCLALARLLAEPALGRAFFLVAKAGERAGYLVFTFGFDHEVGGPLATVTDLFIEPEHRRKGLARAALQFVAGTCRALGVRSLELQPEAHNAAGRALYEACGFRVRDRVPMFLPL